jgi:hypothetical protein
MKKVVLKMIIAALIFTAAFTACRRKPGEVKFETIEVQDGYRHPKSGVKDGNSIDYSIRFTYPSQYGNTAVMCKRRTAQRDNKVENGTLVKIVK